MIPGQVLRYDLCCVGLEEIVFIHLEAARPVAVILVGHVLQPDDAAPPVADERRSLNRESVARLDRGGLLVVRDGDEQAEGGCSNGRTHSFDSEVIRALISGPESDFQLFGNSVVLETLLKSVLTLN